LGAVRDTLSFVRTTVLNEINAATDNPLIFPEEPGPNKAFSGGNFHGEPLALAMDFLGIAVAEVGSIAERRIFRLLDGTLNSDLPAMLTQDSGLQSGLMLSQYTAAALVSDNKTLAHPDSVDSIPTGANQEDHVSMSTNAARHALEIVWNTEQIVAIELLCAAQALDLRTEGSSRQPGQGTRAAYQALRDSGIAPLDRDRILAPDIAHAAALVHNAQIAEAVAAALQGNGG
jgi:histidine ammonia-lyase